MADFLDYFGQTLTLSALWLSKVSGPVPWPLVLAFLFLPCMMAFRVFLWFMRGTIWPVPCKYFHTQQRRSDKACRMVVPGEWYYCRHHRHRKEMSDHHQCDPRIPRWQKRVGGGKLVERRDIRGVGFVRLLSTSETLLFHKGVARRPRQVWPGVKELSGRYRRGAARLRGLRPRDVLRKSEERPAGVAARMPRVVYATRITLVSFLVGMLAVGVSVLVGKDIRAVPQYVATICFILAWDVLRFSVWKDPDRVPRWLRAAIIDAVKAFVVLVILAIIGDTIDGGMKGVQGGK